MDTLRSRLIDDPELRVRLSKIGKPRFRTVAASIVLPAYVAILYFTWTESWEVFLIFGALSTALFVGVVLQLRLEKQIVSDYRTTVATVLERKVGPGPKRGVHIQYGFVDETGNMFLGSVGGSIFLPKEGRPIPILYSTTDPHLNAPLKSFWFYDF